VPEGDTVFQAARRLGEALAGRVLTRTDFRVPRHATVDLTGRSVSEVISRGKHLLIRVDPDVTIHTHFRMDGAWRTFRSGQRWRGGPQWQVRIVLSNTEFDAVGYRIPVIDVIRRTAEDDVVGHLGPDLLGPDWDAAEATRRLGEQPDRAIGEALLDQRNLAGIGNLYKAECLYITGISPWTPVGEVPDLARVVQTARRLLLANRDHPWQVTTGINRRGHEHWVFERSGQPCRRCGTAIKSARQGQPPADRVTYWCPLCQPA
jgi:endonuclease VIII